MPATASRTFGALSQVLAFFEERRGRLYGFRWRDRLDHSSAVPGAPIAPTDQVIGVGDGLKQSFQLSKTYGALHLPYRRPIAKPVPQSVRVAVAESEIEEGAGFSVDSRQAQSRFSPATFRQTARRLRLDSFSMCRCAFTPIISKRTCLLLQPARFQKFLWWRLDLEDNSGRFTGKAGLCSYHAMPVLSHHSCRRIGTGFH